MSSKTPVVKSAKTESAPKSLKSNKKNSLLFGSICLAIISLTSIVIYKNTNSSDMRFGSETVSLDYALTAQEREKGLSGRNQLAWDRGMLFQFETPGLHCFWMKDMKFSIDIVWLDSDKKVIDMRENVSPDTYPAQFCPAQNASYTVEVHAGLSKKAGVDIGDQLQLAVVLK